MLQQNLHDTERPGDSKLNHKSKYWQFIALMFTRMLISMSIDVYKSWAIFYAGFTCSSSFIRKHSMTIRYCQQHYYDQQVHAFLRFRAEKILEKKRSTLSSISEKFPLIFSKPFSSKVAVVHKKRMFRIHLLKGTW